jgi:hypothetical protein
MSGRSLTRRVITWLLLGLYGLVASGLPLPFEMPLPGEPRGGDRVAAFRLAAKDRSRPFPCMDKACGCATAEQCFANCCCHTPAERLAWARAHNVEPAVLVTLEARMARQSMKPVVAATPPAAAAPQPSCCASAATAALDAEDVCCEYQSLAANPTDAIQTRTLPAPADHKQENEHENEPTSRCQVIVLRALLACGGLAAEWFALGGGGLPPPRVEFVLCAGSDEPLVAADETPFRLAAPPAAPPPRAA